MQATPKSFIMERLLQPGTVTAADEELYLYLGRKNCSLEVPFHINVRPWVEKKYPAFYSKYKNPQDLQEPLSKYAEFFWACDS